MIPRSRPLTLPLWTQIHQLKIHKLHVWVLSDWYSLFHPKWLRRVSNTNFERKTAGKVQTLDFLLGGGEEVVFLIMCFIVKWDEEKRPHTVKRNQIHWDGAEEGGRLGCSGTWRWWWIFRPKHELWKHQDNAVVENLNANHFKSRAARHCNAPPHTLQHTLQYYENS